MNAAAKSIEQTTLFNGHLAQLHFSKEWAMTLILITSIFISAMGVVYVTHLYRVQYNQYQSLRHHYDVMHLKKGQLLLEKASLSSEARIIEKAQDKLHMILPRQVERITIS